MVCSRCIAAIKNILHRQNLDFNYVNPGEVELTKIPDKETIKKLDTLLKKEGFELIESKKIRLIEKIKLLVQNYLNNITEQKKIKLSAFITSQVAYDYTYLSHLFSSVEGITIEQYFILLRIEKVKELIVYNQQNLSEIAYITGFSSVHHLSSQFKKVTGLSPGYFKKMGINKRRLLDKL
jgi:AraC-like DNA-binding protein